MTLHAELFKRSRHADQLYTSCFCSIEEYDYFIRFTDDAIPDMYDHNFVFIRDSCSPDRVLEIIQEESETRRASNQKFANFSFNSRDDLDWEHPLLKQGEREDYLCMVRDSGLEGFRKGNPEGSVVRVEEGGIVAEAAEVDREIHREEEKNKDFTERRIARKMKVFLDPLQPLDLYICFHDGKPIGKCELCIDKKNRVAKIEDFELLPAYQRKGFGTTVLKHLFTVAAGEGVKHMILFTEKSGTARQMYKKTGFSVVGEEIGVFYRFE